MQEHVVQQSGQFAAGAMTLVVFRTLADQEGPYAVLRLRSGEKEEIHEVTLRPEEHADLDGAGRLTLMAIEPSTRQRRGAVRFTLAPQGGTPLAGAVDV